MQSSTRIDELRAKFHENPRRYFAPLANEYRKAGDPEQAIVICRAHLAQQPGHMSGHVVYAQALYDAQRKDEARTVFEQALALDPENIIVLRHLGDIARERGETAEARHWYARGLDGDPHDTEIAAYLAELTEPLGNGRETLPEPSTDAGAAAAEDVTPLAADDVAAPTAEDAAPSAIETTAEPEAEQSADITGEAGERAWRDSPGSDKTPFVTRTMAELYVRQGYLTAALHVYRKLAAEHPGDRDLADRIAELSEDESSAQGESSPQAQPTEAAQDVHTVSAPEETGPPTSALVPQSSLEESSDVESTDDQVRADEVIAATSSQTNITETELGGDGDSWDSDLWAAGFSSDESTDARELGAADAGRADSQVQPAPDEISPAKREVESMIGGSAGYESMTAHVAQVDSDSESSAPQVGLDALDVVPDTASDLTVDGSASAIFEPIVAPRAAESAAESDLDTVPATGDSDVAPRVTDVDRSEAGVVRSGTAFQPEVESPIFDTDDDFAEAGSEVVAPHEAECEEEIDAGFTIGAHPGFADEATTEPDADGDSEPFETGVDPALPRRDRWADAAAPAEPESGLVAYPPQIPDATVVHGAGEATSGPTIREFFALLGAARPPEAEPAAVDTTRASAPSIGDAFDDLFPDDEVSDEDSRAAFALSGAVGGPLLPSHEPDVAARASAQQPGQRPSPQAATTPSPPPPVPTYRSADAGQESEEDICKFREWLDGLAEP